MKTKGKQVKKKLSELKQDDELLEIRKINIFKVSEYRQAMRLGDKFPPIVITEDDVIVSGNHRYESYMLEFPEDYVVDCIQKAYQDRKEIICDFMEYNSKHGMPLDSFTKRKAILKYIDYGGTLEELSAVLGMSVKSLTKLGEDYVIEIGSNERKAIKSYLDIQGEKVTKKQYAEHAAHDRAIPAWTNAEQLTRHLKNGWVDMKDQRNIDALTDLYHTLQGVLDQIV